MLVVRVILSLIALYWLRPAVVLAQVPADLQQATRARDQAVSQADTAAWDRLTTEDFTVVGEDGRMRTKAVRLAELGQQKPQASPPTRQREQVKLYGNTAVRRLRSGDVWVIEVWVKEARGWRAAAVQVTTAH